MMRPTAHYGTTVYGGGSGVGTIFKLDPHAKLEHAGICAAAADNSAYAESTLYAFQGGSDGKNPESTLIQKGGLLYGTAFFGGTGNGSVFTIAP